MLNYEYPPLGGGAANANYYMLKEFAKKKDIYIDLVTSSAKNTFEVEQFSKNIKIFKLNIGKKDVHYWKMPEIFRWTYKTYLFSKKLIKQNKYDLCHCWFGWPSGLIGYWFRNKMPYIVSLRGSDIPGYNPRLWILDALAFSFISKIVWRNAKVVITLSKNSLEMAKRTLNCGFKVIYNGVNTKEFYPQKKSIDEIRLLYVGRLIERKGIEYIIMAIADITKKHPDKKIRLTIVGSGNIENKLEFLVKRLQLLSQVSFLGVKKHEELPKIYREHDILIIASINEALGNVTQEAMASGLAIITTNTGAAELLAGNGIVVPKRNSKAIAQAVCELMDDPEARRQMGLKSREIAERMGWSAVSEAYLRLYEELA